MRRLARRSVRCSVHETPLEDRHRVPETSQNPRVRIPRVESPRIKRHRPIRFRLVGSNGGGSTNFGRGGGVVLGVFVKRAPCGAMWPRQARFRSPEDPSATN